MKRNIYGCLRGAEYRKPKSNYLVSMTITYPQTKTTTMTIYSKQSIPSLSRLPFTSHPKMNWFLNEAVTNTVKKNIHYTTRTQPLLAVGAVADSIIGVVHRLRSRSRSRSKSHSRVSSPGPTQDDKEKKYSRRRSIDMRGDYGDVYLENLREEREEGATKNSAGSPPPPANKNTRKPWSWSPSRASSHIAQKGQEERHAEGHSIPSGMSTLEINTPHDQMREGIQLTHKSAPHHTHTIQFIFFTTMQH